LATTPGTRFITLGGAIANDVHGKNHHVAGSFGCSVREIGLARSDQGFARLSLAKNADLFAATIAGMGLTGLITWAECQLTRIPSSFIDQEILPFDTLSDFFAIASESVGRYEHTMAWVDCAAKGESLGQGLFSRGNWSREGSLKTHAAPTLQMPFDAPSFVLNPLALRTFNRLIRGYQLRKARKARVHYASALFPLDSIRAWNRLYGRRGFFQYQCVIPPATARPALEEMLDVIARAGEGSFLSVLKTFGAIPSPGLLSFPMEGTTLALDFRNKGPRTLELLARLDGIVKQAGGRLYPAKDGRMSAQMFQAGYPHWERFMALVDPAFSSAFWRRVSA
jgi:L-gulonolactone oxidase